MPCAVASVSSPPLFSPSPGNLSSPVIRNPTETQPPAQPSPEMFSIWNRRVSKACQEKLEHHCAPTGTMMRNRKRPPKIVLPPKTELEPYQRAASFVLVGDLESEGDCYAVFCKKGKRRIPMEDRYAAVLGIQGNPTQAIFGVFDGHGGPQAADFASKNLEKNVMSEMFERNVSISEAVKRGYLATDDEFLKQDIHGGTCCLTAVMHEGDLIVSNAGDCRAVLSRCGVAEPLTVDHKASLKDEQDRIRRKDGSVVEYDTGVCRVEGTLAVTRAIGDGHLKKFVVAEPETTVLKIRPEFEFLIMASDGLWDTVTNQEAVDVVRSLCVDVEKPEEAFSAACKKLVDLSVSRGSVDDISVMVIELSRFIQ